MSAIKNLKKNLLLMFKKASSVNLNLLMSELKNWYLICWQAECNFIYIRCNKVIKMC